MRWSPCKILSKALTKSSMLYNNGNILILFLLLKDDILDYIIYNYTSRLKVYDDVSLDSSCFETQGRMITDFELESWIYEERQWLNQILFIIFNKLP